MNPILFWLCKLLTLDGYQEGNPLDFPTILIMIMTTIIIIIVVISICYLIISLFSNKSKKQNQKVQQLEKLLIKQANKQHTGIINTLINPTPEIKKQYQAFDPKERDQVIYKILSDIQNSDDNNNTALLVINQQTITTANNIINHV